MPDYPTMYRKLFNAQTDAIEGLQAITARLIKEHQQVEEMYIEAPEPTLTVLERKEPDEDEPDKDE